MAVRIVHNYSYKSNCQSGGGHHSELGRCFVAVLFRVNESGCLADVQPLPGLTPPSMSWKWSGRDWYRSSYEAALPGRVWAMTDTIATCLKYGKSLSPLKRMELQFWNKYSTQLRLGSFDIDKLLIRAAQCKSAWRGMMLDDLISPTRIPEKGHIFEALVPDFLAIRRNSELRHAHSVQAPNSMPMQREKLFDFAVFLFDLLHRSECGSLAALNDAEFAQLKYLADLKWKAFRQEPSAAEKLVEVENELSRESIQSYLQRIPADPVKLEASSFVEWLDLRVIRYWRRKWEVERFFFNGDSLLRRECRLLIKRAWDSIEEYIKVHNPRIGRDLGPLYSVWTLRSAHKATDVCLDFHHLFDLYSTLVSLHLQSSWRVGDSHWFQHSPFLDAAQTYLTRRLKDALLKQANLHVVEKSADSAPRTETLSEVFKKKKGIIRKLLTKQGTTSHSGTSEANEMEQLSSLGVASNGDSSQDSAAHDERDLSRLLKSHPIDPPDMASLLYVALTNLFSLEKDSREGGNSLRALVSRSVGVAPDLTQVKHLMQNREWQPILSNPILCGYRDSASKLAVAYQEDDDSLKKSQQEWNEKLWGLLYPTPTYRPSKRFFARLFSYFLPKSPLRMP